MTNDPREFPCMDDSPENNGNGYDFSRETIEIDNDETDEYNPEIDLE